MRYDNAGRVDLSGIVVEPHEIAFAQSSTRNNKPRAIPVITRNIALGKAIGTYDPDQARKWWAGEQRRQAAAKASATRARKRAESPKAMPLRERYKDAGELGVARRTG